MAASSSAPSLAGLPQATLLAPAVVLAAVALGVGGSSPASLQDQASRLMGALCAPCELSVGWMLAAALAVGLLMLQATRPSKRRVYVLDFQVYKPHASWMFPRHKLRDLCESRGCFTEDDIQFQERIAYRTGLGDRTAVVPAIQCGSEDALGLEPARFEFSTACFTVVQELLAKAGVQPSQVKFVITNSSLFNPTPSLSAMIVNHFKMPTSTIGYSLGGMGCSAGVIALDLAKEMLELHPNSYALVVSHENITNAFYAGKDRSMLICNCLFRANGSAVLLTNKPRDARRAKYEVQHIVRTHLAADDVAFGCVMQLEDAERKVGVRLNKDLIKVGTKGLRLNMTALGPKVLPLAEQLKYGANMLLRKAAQVHKPLAKALPAAWLQPYTPDFRKAFDFFAIHTGGRGIIDGLEKEMGLSRRQVEPSRASLYHLGNTSSTSVWYELAYIESRQGVARGQKVWQLAFGSGFKFNSSVLVANRKVSEAHPAWDDFDAAAMWADLDALEASAEAARAEKAKLQGSTQQQQQPAHVRAGAH